MLNKLQTEADGRDIRDCRDYDMHIDQAHVLNERMGTLPHVYYYSVPCSYTKKMGERYVPEKGMEPFFVMRSFQIGQYTGMTKSGIKIDQEWNENDGRVSTISELRLLEHLAKNWSLIILSLESGMCILFITVIICHCRAGCFIKRISGPSTWICFQ